MRFHIRKWDCIEEDESFTEIISRRSPSSGIVLVVIPMYTRQISGFPPIINPAGSLEKWAHHRR
jgi:hypothetical protein